MRNWNAFHLTESPIQALISTCRLYDRSNSGRKCRLSEGCRQFRWFANDSNPCCCVNRWKSLWFSRNDFLHTNFAVIYRFVKEWVEKHEQAASVVAVGGIIDEEN